MKRYPSLSSTVTAGDQHARPLDVLVVTSEFIGPIKNGGIGAATTGLVEQLLRDGHNVTILYTLVERNVPACAEQTWSHWVQVMNAKGVALDHIEHTGDYRAWRAKSWLVKEYIQSRNFNLVYFNEHHGSGYYSITAKRAGLEPFVSQLHCVITHGSIEWVFSINDQYLSRPTDLEMMGLERRSVEWADVVIGPSQYILQTYRGFGWNLPERTYHQPLPLYRSASPVEMKRVEPIDEIVFFGRLETRKGLWLFCDALDILTDKLSAKRVTFLGRTTSESGMSTGPLLLARSGGWPCRLRMLTDFGQEQALRYLRKPGRLAVMPSLADNSPCVIYECMENGIPFISTLGSGAQELVDDRDWAGSMVQPTAEALADKLANVLDGGARMARPSFDPVDNLAGWSKWHAQVGSEGRRRKPAEHPTKAGKDTTSLLVIDSGCSLKLLLRNMLSNIARFENRMEIALVSPRRGVVRKLLDDILLGGGRKLRIFHPSESDAITRFAIERPFAFFTDATCEVAPNLIDHTTVALKHAAAATCATVETTDREKDAIIRNLPIGGLVAQSALGYPIGSEIWACRTDLTQALLRSLVYLDPQTDVASNSLALGQQLMRRAQAEGQDVLLIPLVGGLVFREEKSPLATGIASRNLERAAEALGVDRSIHLGGVEWIGISSFGLMDEQLSKPASAIASSLPEAHPLGRFARGELPDTAAFAAAACGRSSLAFELAASQLANSAEARKIGEVLINEERERPRLNLLPPLNDAWEYRRADGKILRARPQAQQIPPRLKALLDSRAKSNRAAAERPSSVDNATVPATVVSYIDANSFQTLLSGLRYSPGADRNRRNRISFVDVPLLGHEELTIRMTISGGTPPQVAVSVADAQSGEVFSAITAETQEGLCVAVLPLYKMFLSSAVVIEFSGGSENAVEFEAIFLE